MKFVGKRVEQQIKHAIFIVEGRPKPRSRARPRRYA